MKSATPVQLKLKKPKRYCLVEQKSKAVALRLPKSFWHKKSLQSSMKTPRSIFIPTIPLQTATDYR